MNKFKLLQKIKKLYDNGENLIHYLKTLSNSEKNNIEDILISYDFQAGSYIKGYADDKKSNHLFCGHLANIIHSLEPAESILEAGIGESTKLVTLLRNLNYMPKKALGFDISWSRLKFAQNFLIDNGINHVNLFAANLFEIPLLDNSIDIVYTSHAIEPNGGMEELALSELYRITKKYLVLLEPAYELASHEAKERMNFHGYVKNLPAIATNLGYKIIEYRLFDYQYNPHNPTGLIIIEKTSPESNDSELVCPLTKNKLIDYSESFLYSKDSFLTYPILEKIPLLLKENAILATHLLTDYNQYKKEHNIIL